MYRILTASSDAYITNKILNNKFRVTDSNTGQSATLDLFKLYAESTSGSDKSPKELSRLLIKFNLKPLRELTGSTLDINHSSFKCQLELYDVYGGQTTPNNFKLIVFPLSKSFDEGMGRDVVLFQDLDTVNFLTSSIVNTATPVTWSKPGANDIGLLNSTTIDVIASGNLNDGNGTVDLWKQQVFKTGEENLSIDVTTVISGTLAGLIPDNGFRISFSGTQETDAVTRFVKRFGSRHCTDPSLRPRLVVTYNDSTQDHHKIFYFDISGSLFLNNFHRGAAANILSGASGTEITASNSLILELRSGSKSKGTYFSKIVTGSQHKIGNNYISGTYSASFSISQFSGTNKGEIRNNSLRNEIKNAGSATLKEIWGSLDGTVGYLTSSIIINSVDRTSFDNKPSRLIVSITNMVSEYRLNERARLRVFVEDVGGTIQAKKLPIENVSEIFTKMYYRVRDFVSGDVIIPFHKNGTILSTDSTGMYFDLYMDSLHRGRLYVIDFKISDKGFDQVFEDVAAKFRVV